MIQNNKIQMQAKEFNKQKYIIKNNKIIFNRTINNKYLIKTLKK